MEREEFGLSEASAFLVCMLCTSVELGKVACHPKIRMKSSSSSFICVVKVDIISVCVCSFTDGEKTSTHTQ